MAYLRSRPDLLDSFRKGDRAALEEVYWAYVDRVVWFLRRSVRPGEVRDLLQEVFIRAFSESSRAAYDGVRDYGPYLLTVARNLVVDAARKSGRELSLEDLPFEEPAATEERAVEWADSDTMRIVESYLQSLSDEVRGVHDARYVRGLSQRDAADHLGITRQQLRTLEAKLRTGLARALKNHSPMLKR
jgi:RNA polymerase sigma-70 factor (ECF subfamily)